MLMQIETKGATHLVINLSTDNVAYVQDMLRMVENNIVAVKHDYYGAEVVEMDTTITVGKHVKFSGNEYTSDAKPDLIVSAGESEDIIKNYEAVGIDLFTSIKDQLKKAQDARDTLKKENEYLKAHVSRLEDVVESLKDVESNSEEILQ